MRIAGTVGFSMVYFNFIIYKYFYIKSRKFGAQLLNNKVSNEKVPQVGDTSKRT